VNAFVNAGLSNDLLICKKEAADDWVFSNKDEGQIAAAASVGMLQLWDIDEGLESIDKYMREKKSKFKLVLTLLSVSSTQVSKTMLMPPMLFFPTSLNKPPNNLTRLVS